MKTPHRQWTNPYFGVSHLVLNKAYATVTDRDTFSEAYWLWKPVPRTQVLKSYEHSGYKPTIVDYKMFRGENHNDKAKAWLEAKTKGVD